MTTAILESTLSKIAEPYIRNGSINRHFDILTTKNINYAPARLTFEGKDVPVFLMFNNENEIINEFNNSSSPVYKRLKIVKTDTMDVICEEPDPVATTITKPEKTKKNDVPMSDYTEEISSKNKKITVTCNKDTFELLNITHMYKHKDRLVAALNKIEDMVKDRIDLPVVYNLDAISTFREPLKSKNMYMIYPICYNTITSVKPVPSEILGFKSNLITNDAIIISPNIADTVIIDEGGTTILDKNENTLYSFIDIFDTNLNDKDYDTFLEKYISLVVLNYFGTPEDKIKLDEIKKDAKRRQFMNICSELILKVANENQKEIVALEKNIEGTQKMLFDMMLKYERLVIASKSPETLQKEISESLYEDFNRIYNMKDIISVDFNGKILTLLTDTLYSYDNINDCEREIGKFKITIPLDGSSADAIRWINLTRKVEGNNAPHVYSDGHACLGNISTTLNKLLATGQFSQLVTTVLLFPQTANTSDSFGRHIVDWPKSKRSK